MRLHQVGVLAAAILLGSLAVQAAEGPNVGELVRELAGDKPAATRTPAELEAACLQVLDSLMADLGSEDMGKRQNAQGTIERIAFHASRPGAEADRAACSKALAARLADEVPTPARVWIIRQLERIGAAEAVAPLARLLNDKDAQVRESARRALQKNPADQAGLALGAAIASANDPAWRVALLNALAWRGEKSSLELLTQEAASDRDDIRVAALRGLVKIGDKSAAATLATARTKGSAAARVVATDCCLGLAAALADQGDKPAALAIYKGLLASQGHIRCAAVIGLGRAGTAADLPAILDALAGADARLGGACVEALVLLQGPDVTAAIVSRTAAAEGQAKPALLRALARRGDKAAVPAFVAAAEDADLDVRVDAIRGLGVLGDAAVVPLLLQAAAATGRPQEAARESLLCLPGEAIDQALQSRVEEKDPKVRLEVVRALAGRHVTGATAALLHAAQDADAAVRGEALKALGSVATADALAAVATLLVKAPDDAARNDAANTLVRIAGREGNIEKRAEPILQALDSARGPARLALLGVLGHLGGSASLQAVRAAVKEDDTKVRDAAIRALADWPDAAAAQDLLDLATGAAEETYQVLAVRAYVRVVRLDRDRPSAQTAQMLIAALALAKRPEEKRQVLGALAEVRHVRALDAVAACLDQPALAQEAAHAAVRIGRDIVNDSPQAVQAAMQKVLGVTKNPDVQKQAKETLDRAEQKLKEKR